MKKLDDHIELKRQCDILTDKGIKWLQSNSYSEQVFELYKQYKIECVLSSRAINRYIRGSNEIKEVLIRNY